MHGRAQIRAAAVSALSAATTGTVYIEQANRLGSDDMPAIIVYLGADTNVADERAMGRYEEFEQTLTLELHAVGATGASVASALDDMDEETEQLLAASAPLSGLLRRLDRESSSAEMNTEQDRVWGLRSVTYIATWRYAFGAPETPEV